MQLTLDSKLNFSAKVTDSVKKKLNYTKKTQNKKKIKIRVTKIYP
jgi:hypothetical protein